jgi:hypothetical protein
MRAEWPLLQHQLIGGHFAEASRTLAEMAAEMPNMRRGIYASALGAGVSPEFAARNIVPAGTVAGDEFVKFLVERRYWDGIVPAVRALGERSGYSLPDTSAQLIFDNLFAAEATSEMVRLSEVLAGRREPGWAYPWMARPMAGVSVRIDSGTGPPAVEIDFEAPGNIAYGHVYRHFAVDASQQYILEAQVRTDLLSSAEPVRIAVRSPARTLAVSDGLRGSRPWQTVRVVLAPGPADHVVRVEIMRPRSSRAEDGVMGRLYLRNVRLIAGGGSAT